MVFPISEKGHRQPQKSDTSQKKPSGSFKQHLNKQTPLPQTHRGTVFDFPKHKEKRREKDKPSTPHIHGHGEHKVNHQSVSQETKVSEVSELSDEMIDLTQKMADFITLESKKGISTIELTAHLDPGSIFDGTGILIEHYDTAPHSFNIELSHSLESTLGELTAQLPSLMKALQSRLENFQINLLPPTFAKEKTSQKVMKSRDEKKVDKLRESLHNWNKKN